MLGNNLFEIVYVESVKKYDIPSLTPEIRKRVKKAIESKLTIDPIGYGKPLQYSLKGYRRLRVGDYRVIYIINIEKHIVIISAISHRKDIYADA